MVVAITRSECCVQTNMRSTRLLTARDKHQPERESGTKLQRGVYATVTKTDVIYINAYTELCRFDAVTIMWALDIGLRVCCTD